MAVELGAPTLCALRGFAGTDGETLFPGDRARTGTDPASFGAGKTKKGKVPKTLFKLFGKYWTTGKLKLQLSEKYKERIYNSSG